MTDKIWLSLTKHPKMAITTALIVLILFFLPIVLKFAAIAWLEKNGASNVLLADIDLNIFTGNLRVEGLSFGEKEKQQTSLSEITVNIGMLNLIRKRVLAEDITIKGLNLAVENQANQLHFGLSTSPTNQTPPSPDGEKSENRMASFPGGIQKLTLMDSKITYRQDGFSCFTDIDNLLLQNLYPWDAEATTRIGLDAHINKSPLRVDLQLAAFSAKKQASISINLDHLSLAEFAPLATTITDLHGILDLENHLTITLSEADSLAIKLSGPISIADLMGSFKMPDDRSLILKDLDLTWQGNADVSFSSEYQPQRLVIDGELHNHHLLLELPHTKLKAQHQGIQLPLTLNWDRLPDLNLLTVEAAVQMQQLLLHHAGLDLDLLSLNKLQAEAIRIQGINQIHCDRLLTQDLVLVNVDTTQKAALPESPLITKMIRVDGIHLLDRSDIRLNLIEIQDVATSIYRNDSNRFALVDLIEDVTGSPSSGNNPAMETQTQEPSHVAISKSTPKKSAASIGIGKLSMSGTNRIHIIDESIEPAFDHTIEIDHFVLKGVDSRDTNRAAHFELELQPGKNSRATSTGTVKLFQPKKEFEINGKVEHLNLPWVSPYLSRYLGYVIKTGVLSMDYSLISKAGILDIDNQIIMKNIKLIPDDPEKIDQLSKQLTMPLDTALSILRDQNNDVRISIPVSGDSENPDFNLNSIIGLAVRKALKMASVSVIKHLLQPYGSLVTIASLVKKGGEYLAEIKIDPIEFESGNVEPSLQATDYLKTVANLLSEKENLRLTICAVSVPGDLPDLSVNDNQSDFLTLAEQRAQKIQDYFMTQGISIERLFMCNPAVNMDESAQARAMLSL